MRATPWVLALFLCASCEGTSPGTDRDASPGDEAPDAIDPGDTAPTDLPTDLPPDAADLLADLPTDPAPDAADLLADLPTDPAPDAADVPAELPVDVPPDAPGDVPPSTCCLWGYGGACPAGWECVAIPGKSGACKPIPGPDACWSGHDCGPGRTCLGANPCACDAVGEGDGCDIPGHCIDDTPGCCDSDRECPSGQVCVPGGTCRDAPLPGRCWTKADCYGMGQDCVGVIDCGCGLDCIAAPSPGTCSPLPTSCCNSDADCPEDTVCRFGTVLGHEPGRCVASHLGPACPGDFACCWEDRDCPGGWCEGALGCGCIELCPICGACIPDQIGTCRPFTIDVDLTSSAGECVPGDSSPIFTYYRVPLGWHTSLPAKTQIEQAVNAFTGGEGYMPMDEGYVQDHAFDVRLGNSWFTTPARVGDVMLVRVRAFGEAGDKGLSENLEIPVDATLAACLFPYDRTCSDGTPVVCRALPPPCDKDKVTASFQGCQHCVYAATCSCDDGAPVIGAPEPPTCETNAILAAQGGSWTCVNPITCNDSTR